MSKFTRLYIFLLFCFMTLTTSFAQSPDYQIKGVVTDSLQVPLIGATVALVNSIDSTLISFAITDGAGAFTLNRIHAQPAMLQITYIGHGTFEKPVDFSGNDLTIDVGEIWLSPQNHTLEAIVVKSEHIPVIIKGDTIQYQADAFATRPDDNVENLLKKLPGVEVDRDGSIKAQGEEVNKVLVDGKPFFGDNAQIATRNLSADAVDAVQVYDEESELEQFSGIDDGEEEKTINLVLKEDKKNGQFGKISAGYGTDDRYKAKANINRFSTNTRLSVLGMSNNRNDAGFSINEYINFIGGIGRLMAQGGGEIRLDPSSMGLPLAGENTPGISTTSALGLNLNHDFSERTSLSSNYFYSRWNYDLNQTSLRQNLLEESTFQTQNEISETSKTNGHRLNTELKHRINDRQRLTFSGNFGQISSERSRNGNIENKGTTGFLENQSRQQYQLRPDQWQGSMGLNYFLKFKKEGQLLATRVAFDGTLSDGIQLVSNNNRFLQADQTWLADSLQQRQENQEDKLSWNASTSYTTLFAKNWYWKNKLEVAYEKQATTKDFFDNIEAENFQFNPDLSRQFNRTLQHLRAGTGFMRNGIKSSFDLYVEAQKSTLLNEIQPTGKLPERDYFFFLPRLRLKYDFTDFKGLDFRYNTSVSIPSIEQLQPIVDNSNPLNIYIGNPSLKPSYQHRLAVQFRLIDQFSFTNFFLTLSTAYIKNHVINKQSIDEQLRQVRTPINVNRAIQNRAYSSFSTPIKALGIGLQIDGEAGHSNGFISLNNNLEAVTRWNQNWSVRIGNRKKEKIDWEVGTRWNYGQAKFERQTGFNQNYSQSDHFALFTAFLPKEWTIGTEAEWSNFSTENYGIPESFVLWQASISKSFLKNNRLLLKLSGYDLLNQNRGIDRQNAFNYFEERRFNTLGRHFMLSASYKLAAFNAPGTLE